MRVDKVTLLFILLLLFTLLEALCLTQFVNNPGLFLNNGLWPNSIYLFSGLAIPMILLAKIPKGDIGEAKMNIPVAAIITIGMCVFTAAMLIIGNRAFQSVSINAYADMLPKIKVMNERLLHHQNIYTPIKELWGIQPNYFPAMWMPFLPAVIFNFDLRMITLIAVLIGLALTIFSITPRNWNWYSLLALVPFALLVNNGIYREFFILSEEGLVVGFYLLLAYSIVKNNYWLQGIAICLCLLSRFSFLGWVPLFFFISFFHVSRRNTIKGALAAFVLGVILMVSSKAIFHLDTFINQPKFYSGNLSDPNDTFHIDYALNLIKTGFGIAKFLPFEQVHWLGTAVILATVAFPFLGWFIYKKMKVEDNLVFLLAMLKLNLVLFYNLLVMPYLYLFYTSAFLSCFILFWYSKNLGRPIVKSL